MPVGAAHVDGCRACVRMLADVGDALRDDVVGGHLERLLEAVVDVDEQVDRDRRPCHHRLERHVQPVAAENRRMDSVRNVAELRERQRDLLPRLVEPRLRVRLGVELLLQHVELERERDQTLLRSVVEIPFEPLPLLLTRGDHPCA
ncbi:MAG: hypothetical protein AUG91_06665 [Actinobacteria bacterium 13_1_20CM_4_69_9]|nr:MAG: hypothetical protein AUG91_06665 [Actinobacteria bacterium 13_1_20CM_4_69_9]